RIDLVPWAIRAERRGVQYVSPRGPKPGRSLHDNPTSACVGKRSPQTVLRPMNRVEPKCQTLGQKDPRVRHQRRSVAKHPRMLKIRVNLRSLGLAEVVGDE